MHFAIIEGNIATGERIVTNWPLIVYLKADPHEEMHEEGEIGYLRWYGDNMWLFVPVQAELKKFFVTIPQYPFQEGASLSAGGINYNTLKAMKAMKMLEELEQRFPVGSYRLERQILIESLNVGDSRVSANRRRAGSGANRVRQCSI